MPPKEPVFSTSFWRGLILLLTLPTIGYTVTSATKIQLHDATIAKMQVHESDDEKAHQLFTDRLVQLQRQDEITANMIQTNIWVLSSTLTDRIESMQRADQERYMRLENQLARYSDLLNQLQVTISRIKQPTPPGL